jgi:CRISPR-associated protein Csm5
MRTALLDQVNDGAGLQQTADRRTGRPRDENNQELQNRLFRYRAGKFELDPMRLVQLADAAWNGEPGLPAAQVHLAVNRKKAPVKDAHGVLRKSKADELYQILECVPGWHYRAFAGQLNLQFVGELDRAAHGRHVGHGPTHATKLPAAGLRYDMARIAQACNAFYQPILEDEVQKMRDRGYLDPAWDNAIQHLLRQQAERFRRGEVFLLRVGRHSGAESVTLNGVRHIKIMRGKEEKPIYLDQPKTLWLAAEDKDQMQNLLPFGWLLIEVHPIQSAIPDWPELRDACAPHLAAARRLAERLQAKAAEIEQARQAAEARRLAEEEEKRRQAEEDRRQAEIVATRQARLASLSPNQRQVEDFINQAQARKSQLGNAREKANTGLHTLAGQLAKAALESADWNAEEKRALAEAIETWLPQLVEKLDRKDDWKDARKKLKLAALKGEA